MLRNRIVSKLEQGEIDRSDVKDLFDQYRGEIFVDERLAYDWYADATVDVTAFLKTVSCLQNDLQRDASDTKIVSYEAFWQILNLFSLHGLRHCQDRSDLRKKLQKVVRGEQKKIKNICGHDGRKISSLSKDDLNQLFGCIRNAVTGEKHLIQINTGVDSRDISGIAIVIWKILKELKSIGIVKPGRCLHEALKVGGINYEIANLKNMVTRINRIKQEAEAVQNQTKLYCHEIHFPDAIALRLEDSLLLSWGRGCTACRINLFNVLGVSKPDLIAFVLGPLDMLFKRFPFLKERKLIHQAFAARGNGSPYLRSIPKYFK